MVSLSRTIAEAFCHISFPTIFAILMRWDSFYIESHLVIPHCWVIWPCLSSFCHCCCCSVLIHLNVLCFLLIRMLGRNSVCFHCPNPRTSFRPHRWSLKTFKKTSENSRKTWEVIYNVKETHGCYLCFFNEDRFFSVFKESKTFYIHVNICVCVWQKKNVTNNLILLLFTKLCVLGI